MAVNCVHGAKKLICNNHWQTFCCVPKTKLWKVKATVMSFLRCLEKTKLLLTTSGDFFLPSSWMVAFLFPGIPWHFPFDSKHIWWRPSELFHSASFLLWGTWCNLGCSQGEIWIGSPAATIEDTQGVTDPWNSNTGRERGGLTESPTA